MTNKPDHRITIRLKPDEYALLVLKAGNVPLSSFFRALALEKATSKRKKSQRTPAKSDKSLSQILALLGQNELVEAFKQAQQDIANGTTPADDETKELLNNCNQLLNEVRQLLIGALGVSKR